ncbi:chromosome partitioning protein ParA [Burkholderia savannae]|uniref:Chromosome partitioning protein ParA n=1 Tax=Burkholderia savannae TaxID=1637837 RepID=A0ABR5T8V1_9BURK|nr:chromosome partitioning protein ParA [Burkholderia savannae]
METAVDNNARLLFVVLSPVDSDAIPLCVVLKPVDSDDTLLLVVLRPVDSELTLLCVELNPVDNELRPLCVVDNAVAVEVDSDANAWVTAFICDPFTASVDVAEIRPAATFVICRSAPGAPTLTTLVGETPASEYV